MTLTASTPDGISVISVLNGACLRITWFPTSDNSQGYNVYRSEIPYGDFTVVRAYTSQPGFTYFNTPPTPNDNLGNTWWYKVSSVNYSGESIISGPHSTVNYAAFDEKPIPHLSWSSLF